MLAECMHAECIDGPALVCYSLIGFGADCRLDVVLTAVVNTRGPGMWQTVLDYAAGECCYYFMSDSTCAESLM